MGWASEVVPQPAFVTTVREAAPSRTKASLQRSMPQFSPRSVSMLYSGVGIVARKPARLYECVNVPCGFIIRYNFPD